MNYYNISYTPYGDQSRTPKIASLDFSALIELRNQIAQLFHIIQRASTSAMDKILVLVLSSTKAWARQRTMCPIKSYKQICSHTAVNTHRGDVLLELWDGRLEQALFMVVETEFVVNLLNAIGLQVLSAGHHT